MNCDWKELLGAGGKIVLLEKQLNVAYGCHWQQGQFNKEDSQGNRRRTRGRNPLETATAESKTNLPRCSRRKKAKTSFPPNSAGIGCLYLINYSFRILSKEYWPCSFVRIPCCSLDNSVYWNIHFPVSQSPEFELLPLDSRVSFLVCATAAFVGGLSCSWSSPVRGKENRK